MTDTSAEHKAHTMTGNAKFAGDVMIMTREELLREAARLPSWKRRVPVGANRISHIGLPELPSKDELDLILGPNWMVFGQHPQMRDSNGVRRITRKEYHAAQHIAIARRRKP